MNNIKDYKDFCDFNNKLKASKTAKLYEVLSINTKKDQIVLEDENGKIFNGSITKLVDNMGKNKTIALKNPSRLSNFNFNSYKKREYEVIFKVKGYSTVELHDKDYPVYKEAEEEAVKRIVEREFRKLSEVDTQLIDVYESEERDEDGSAITEFVFSVEGYFTKIVTATDKADAVKQVDFIYTETDFGDNLEDITYEEWSVLEI